LTVPVVANFTLVGTNDVATSGSAGGIGMMLRRGTGGYYVNGLVARFPRFGISIRDNDTYARAGSVTTPDLATTDLAIRNVTFLETTTIFQTGTGQNAFDLAGNAIASSGSTTAATLTGFPATITNTTTESAFDWTPTGGSVAASGGLATFTGKIASATATASATGNVIGGTSYIGAAAPGGTKWWAGWTVYAQK